MVPFSMFKTKPAQGNVTLSTMLCFFLSLLSQEFRLLTIFSTTRQFWFISGITMLLLTFVHDLVTKNSRIKNCVQNSRVSIEKTDVIPDTCSYKIWANTVEKTFGDILGWTTRPNARRYQHLPFWNNDLRLLAQSVKQHRQRFGKLTKGKDDSKLPMQAKRIGNLLQRHYVNPYSRPNSFGTQTFVKKWTHSNSQHIREAFQAIRRIGGGSTNSMIPHTKEEMNEEWSTILSSTPKNYSYDGNHWKTKVERAYETRVTWEYLSY